MPVISPELPGGPVSRRRWWVLGVVASGQFMVYLDVTVVNLALPRLAAGLHMSSASVPWVLDAYTLTFGGLLLLGGRVGDLAGRRRMFWSGLTVFLGASLACAVAHAGGPLIVARGVQGVGAAMVSPAALSVATATFTEDRERTVALSVWGALGGLGAIVGVIVGGPVVDLLGWRWAFLLNLPVGGAVLALSWLIPAGRPARRTSPQRRGVGRDVASGATVTGGLLLLVYAIISARVHGWAAAETLGFGAASVGMLTVFRFVDGGSAAPLLPTRLLASPSLLVGCTGEFLAGATELSVMYLVSMQAQRVLGLTPLTAGLGFLPMGLVAAVAAVMTGKITATLGARRTYALGCVAGLAGLVGFAVLFGSHSYPVALLGPGLAMGFALPVTSIVSTIVATSGTRPGEEGIVSGLFNATFEVGASLGLAISATAGAAGLRYGYLAAASFSILGLANAGFGYRKLPRSPTP